MIKNYLVLLGAVILHVLFCAESPFIIKYSSVAYAVSIPLGYALTGILISLLLVPILNIFMHEGQGKKFLKGFTFKSVNMALYLGGLIRLFLFIKNSI